MKSIYDEALDIVTESLEEYDNSVIFNHNGLNLLKKVIEKAQKQEKLLEELKVIFNRHSLRLDRMREWFNLQILESKVLDDIEKLIKEIEK